MRIKTSITLSKDLVARMDRVESNRSAFLEKAAIAYLARLDRAARDLRDREILDRHAARLNRECEDVLGYQELP